MLRFITGLVLPFAFVLSNQLERRIINGTKSEKQYGFMTSIFLNDEHNCGGSLYKPEFIITAAHCMNKPKENYTFYVNTLSIEKKDLKDKQKGYAENITIHNLFDKEYGYSSNDLAIVKLKKPFNNVKLIKISLNEKQQEENYFIAGWGYTRPFGEPYFQPSKFLNELGVSLINYKDCEKEYRDAEKKFETNGLMHGREIVSFEMDIFKQTHVNEKMICVSAKVNKEHSSPSNMDSGGPLFYEKNDVFYLVGTLSWSFQENNGPEIISTLPGVYMKISSYKNFIEENTTN